MADAEYENYKRESRLWWTDVLVTGVLIGGGVDDIGAGLTSVFANQWVAGSLAGMTPVCNETGGASPLADDTVRLGVVAWGSARVTYGIVLFAVGFYRSYIYSTFLPLNMMYGGMVRLVIVASLIGQGVGLGGASTLSPLSHNLLMGWAALVRLGLFGAAFLASFFIYEQTPWYKAAHEGYRQPEPGIREARRGVFAATTGPRQGGLLRG